MKNFNKKYKKFIDSVNLTDEEYCEIKRNVVLNKKRNINFKLKYAVILIFVVFISVLGVTYADKIIEHYTIVTNENLPIEESLGNTVVSNARLNKDFSKDLFKEGEYYTYDEIEEKLGQKILKHEYYDSELFVVNFVEIEKGMLARAGFSLVNKDKTKMFGRNEFGFVIKTNYFTGRSGLSVAGELRYEEYHIESLNTKAIIVKLGKPIINFTYENIAYSVYYNDFVGFVIEDIEGIEDIVEFDIEETFDKFYNFLEGFTLDL